MKLGNTKQESFLLSRFHNKFREEVLLNSVSHEATDASSQSQVSSHPATHIGTIHNALHVLTGGTISSTLTGIGRVCTPNDHDILLYFNLFKGLSDGTLSVEEFNPSQQYSKIRTVKSLLDSENLDVATTSKNYVQRAFNWLNGLVMAGDIDARGYVEKISEAEEVARTNAADLTPIQKIYLISNTKVLMEGRGLEGTTSEEGKAEIPSSAPSSCAATTRAQLNQHSLDF